MRKEKEQEELWLHKEVIKFIRCASSTFLTAKRYEKLRAKAIKDGSHRKYKKTDALAFVEYLQKQFKTNTTLVAFSGNLKDLSLRS